MRRHSLMLLAVAAIGLAASQALAADLQVRKAPAYVPPAPPPVTWTGCYIGANIGGAFGRFKVDTPFGDTSRDNSGFAGGGQVGCDYQFAGSAWVIGLRDMFDGTTNHRERTIQFGPLESGEFDLHNRWFDTLTGRIGYAVQPGWLLYFQGGAVWSRVEADLTFAGTQVGARSDTKTGWTIGGGGEWKFAPQWSAFLEGNYMDFGSRDRVVTTPIACPAGCALSSKATAATVLVGVNYRFY